MDCWAKSDRQKKIELSWLNPNFEKTSVLSLSIVELAQPDFFEKI